MEVIRDAGLLDPAFARPRNAFHYDELDDAAPLAASYAFGPAKSHPFADGNKRSAFMAVGLFLGLIGWELDTGPAEAIQAVVALARSEIGEQEFAAWLRLPIKNVQA